MRLIGNRMVHFSLWFASSARVSRPARRPNRQRACGEIRLQTSTDRFYPDFVAETLDGRLLVVEYKGKDYATNDDSKEKKMIGGVWAKGSNGGALFLTAVKRDGRGRSVHEQIREPRTFRNILSGLV
jgi:hypothetical protein